MWKLLLTLASLATFARGLRRDDLHTQLDLPIVTLPMGTRLYSCQQHELDPQRDLWTMISIKYFGYCTTVEAAAKKMAEMGWQGNPEDIGRFDSRASYAKVWQVVRPCKMLLGDGRNSSTLTHRFGPGARFENVETLDTPNWRSHVKFADMREQLLKSDGLVQCDAGIDVAVFHGISTDDRHACIRQVEPDRLPTATEVEQQQQLLSVKGCDRFT
ncbi:unnamed protein product [Symbiodinium natans]|uniref:Uncharacterized protein n=1 Tax=Symbiodinium natans TaxID=878477 RepID=A0A812KKM3_9DINO|nr:unnamed protein product [Symbiodinium natans]